MEDFSRLADYKIPKNVRAKIKKFLSDKETVNALTNLYLSVNYEESKKIQKYLDPDKEGVDSINEESVGKMKYCKGRIDMLKRCFHYINLWANRIQVDKEKNKKKEVKKNG